NILTIKTRSLTSTTFPYTTLFRSLLNNRHKATGEVFPAAIDTMTTLNKSAAEQSVAAGLKAATDVTGFGLLGHLYKMLRASNVGDRKSKRLNSSHVSISYDVCCLK